MYLDGNSKGGEAKVYQTQLEMKQHKEVMKLKSLLRISKSYLINIEPDDEIDRMELDDIVDSINLVLNK